MCPPPPPVDRFFGSIVDFLSLAQRESPALLRRAFLRAQYESGSITCPIQSRGPRRSSEETQLPRKRFSPALCRSSSFPAGSTVRADKYIVSCNRVDGLSTRCKRFINVKGGLSYIHSMKARLSMKILRTIIKIWKYLTYWPTHNSLKLN